MEWNYDALNSLKIHKELMHLGCELMSDLEEGIKSEILSKELIFWFEKFKYDFCLIYFVYYGKNKIVSETVMS